MKKIVSLFVSSQDQDRHNNINVIRFVAAAMVIYGHMAHLIGVPVPLLFGQEVSSIAVKVFFVLSGYLITQSYLRDSNVFRYFVRRVFRIFPGLIFLCFVTAFIIGPLLSTLSAQSYFINPDTYWYFIKNSIMIPVYGLPGVFSDNYYPNAVNGSLWTLPVEFSMYILLPLAVSMFKKLRILKFGLMFTSIALVLCSVLHLIFFPEAIFVIWGTNIFDGLILAPYFFAGALFSLPEFKRFFNLQVAIVFAFLAGIIVLGGYWKYEIVVFLALPYITLSCSLVTPAIFGRVFAVNDYSYGLYLWAFLVQQTLVSFFGASILSLVPYSILSFVATLICAMISWHFIEKPGNGLGKRLTSWSRSRENERGKKTSIENVVVG